MGLDDLHSSAGEKNNLFRKHELILLVSRRLSVAGKIFI
jgi:hypothetical protein